MRSVLSFTFILAAILSFKNELTNDQNGKMGLSNYGLQIAPETHKDLRSKITLKEGSDTNLEGLWINEDKETRHITKCHFRYEKDRFHVQMWGACLPEDCYWGETISAQVDKESRELYLFWDHGHAERNQTLEIFDEELILVTEIRYKDNSGRPNQLLSDRFIRP